MIGMGRLELGKRLRRTAIRQGTACFQIRQQHQLIGIQNLSRLRHEVNTSKHDHIRIRGCRLLRQTQGIPQIVGHILNISLLIVMG